MLRDGGIITAASGQSELRSPPVVLPRAAGPAALPGASRADRWLFAALVLVICAGFLAATHVYWAPAHPGVDENGYLVGGKMLLERGIGGLRPASPVTGQLDPYLFVGGMWIGADIGTPQERYYPKYPIGFPAMVALALKMGGPEQGPVLAYWINPLCMTLGVAASFLLVRLISGSSFLGILGGLVVAASPVTLGLTNVPNSHASALACVTWGMYLLLCWWREQGKQGGPSGGLWRAALAGLLLGYAATIRYTEATLVLPLLLVVFFTLRRRQVRSYLRALVPLIGWALPVLLLVCFNLTAFGTLTGYDPTNESTGFRWAFFRDNWDAMLRQLETVALFGLLPAALSGLLLLFSNWRLALVMGSWIVPPVLVYTAYYWAPDTATLSIGYMRFFLTILPALAACAMWLMGFLRSVAISDSKPRLRTALATCIIGILAGMGALVNLSGGVLALERVQAMSLFTHTAAQEMLALHRMGRVPAGSVVMAENSQLLHHLQFVSDYVLYSATPFNLAYVRRLAQNLDSDDPSGLQPQRRQRLYERLAGLDQQQLTEEQRSIVLSALDAGRRVFLIVPRRAQDPLPGVTVSRVAMPPQGAANRRAGDARPAQTASRPARAPVPLVRLLGRDLQVQVVAIWNNPARLARFGPNRAVPRNRRLPPPPSPREVQWQLVEVSRRPVPPKPAATLPVARRSGKVVSVRPPATRTSSPDLR